MRLKIARLQDIEKVLRLHRRYQIDSIKEEDKPDGFVTTAFDKEQLSELIEKEQGLFIAVDEDEVIAYVMSASWHYWSRWPMFEQMIKELHHLEYLGQRLSVENSYQYGPVCVDKRLRGSGVLEQLFDLARENMAKKYPILVTFVNKSNPRSYAAHKRKLGLETIQEFTYDGNHYYEMVYDTTKKGKGDLVEMPH